MYVGLIRSQTDVEEYLDETRAAQTHEHCNIQAAGEQRKVIMSTVIVDTNCADGCHLSSSLFSSLIILAA